MKHFSHSRFPGSLKNENNRNEIKMMQTESQSTQENRRPIQARGNRYIVCLAQYFARRNRPTPNQISALSVVFALIGALCLLSRHPVGMLLAALCIQLRLLCNVIDGMVALEGGRKTATGDMFNEFPDRIADSVLLIGAGYACGAGWLGWCAALFAVFTAYIRVFGGSLGFSQSFIGPMAKQQRMAGLTIAAIIAMFETAFYGSNTLMVYALIIIALGTACTCYRRVHDLMDLLNARGLK